MHRFKLKPSKFLSYWYLILYFFALLVLFLINIHGLLKLALAPLLFWHYSTRFKRYTSLPHGVQALTFKQNACYFEVGNQTMPAYLLPDSFISNFFLVLRFKLKNKQIIALTLFPDSFIKPDSLRQLRVILNEHAADLIAQ